MKSFNRLHPKRKPLLSPRDGRAFRCGLILSVCALVLTLYPYSKAEGSIIVNVADDGAWGSVWSYSGSLSSSALGPISVIGKNEAHSVNADTPFFSNTFGVSDLDGYTPLITLEVNGVSAPLATEWGDDYDPADSFTGTSSDAFVFYPTSASGKIRMNTVDSTISGSLTFNFYDIDRFGITAGDVYEYTISTGAYTDTITFNFGTAAVPEPGSITLLGVFFLATGAFIGIRTRRSKSMAG